MTGGAGDPARRFRDAQAIADLWAREVARDPRGALGRLVLEALRLAAFGAAARIGAAGVAGGGADSGARAIATLARAMRDLEQAGKAAAERAALRDAIDRRLARAESGLADPAGGEAARREAAALLGRIREEVYGLFEESP